MRLFAPYLENFVWNWTITAKIVQSGPDLLLLLPCFSIFILTPEKNLVTTETPLDTWDYLIPQADFFYLF